MADIKAILDILDQYPGLDQHPGQDLPDSGDFSPFAAVEGVTLAVGAEMPDPQYDAATIALLLEDLLPDPNGDIVFRNEAGMTEMAIVTEKPLVDSGIVAAHVTADGTDVAGMAYYSFESGPTLYLPMDLHLSVSSSIA